MMESNSNENNNIFKVYAGPDNTARGLHILLSLSLTPAGSFFISTDAQKPTNRLEQHHLASRFLFCDQRIKKTASFKKKKKKAAMWIQH